MILHTISGYDQSTLEKAATPILQGLALCIKDSSPLRNEVTNTKDFWSILRSLHTLPGVAGNTFHMVESVINAKPAVVTADNYEDAVKLLNGYATAASVGAVTEQKRDRKVQRREKSPVEPAKRR